MDSYEDIPYESSPVTETDPDRLAVIARLFGVESADPDECRVLELGCAAGGNLIPLAFRNPRSSYLGIELSRRQVDDGQRLLGRVGLSNAELRQGDIMALGPGIGEFDYILCHGVYSWVPDPVRGKILDLCAGQLKPGGVAYISYNTLPGWRQKGMLRDMLLYHLRDTAEPAERLARAQGFLDLILQTAAEAGADHERVLRPQIERIHEAHPSYFYHEYLEAVNDPFLFSDFMAAAESKGLAYLADTDLHTMFPSALGDAAEAALSGIDEAVEQEQYLDFIRNRSFRQTLLCRAEDVTDRVLDLERFEQMGFFADVALPRKVELRKRKAQVFRRPDGGEVRVEHPLTKAALAQLGSRYPDALGWEEMVSAAQAAVAGAGAQTHAAEMEHLFGELFSLFLHGKVAAVTRPGTVPRGGDHPTMDALARAHVAEGLDHLATIRHTTVMLDPLAAKLVRLLDGSRDLDGLTEGMIAAVEADPSLAGGAFPPGAKPEKVKEQVRSRCAALMGLFSRQGLYEA